MPQRPPFGSNSLAPPPQNLPYPPRPSSSGNGQAPPYPVSDQPPPYSAFSQQPQRASSQPPPQAFQAYNPNPRPNVDTHQYPPDKLPQRPSTLQNMSRPSDYAASYPLPPPPQPQYMANQYPPQNGAYQQVGPGLGSLSQVYNTQRPPRRSSTSGASPYRKDSRSRSRSRSRDGRDSSRKHKHHHQPRPQMQRQKSSGVNTFLGAGGGAIVGDLIFPGLGTLGGAILGGVGGHEFGKKRTQSSPSKNRRKGEFYEDEYRRGRK